MNNATILTLLEDFAADLSFGLFISGQSLPGCGQ